MEKQLKIIFISVVLTSVIISSIIGGLMGFLAGISSQKDFELPLWLRKNILDTQPKQSINTETDQNVKVVKEESEIVKTVEQVSPAVVSIIVSKDLPIIERYYSNNFDDFFGFRIPRFRQKGTESREIGGGSGFLVSKEGYIVTNKHVVEDNEADYTVLMNDEARYEAKVLARDPINDVAVLKIGKKNIQDKDFPYIEFGDSSNLKTGQTVIAIGNALAEFRNTVSTGVISGLARSITAGSQGSGSEDLTNVIQTDASINPGNSGGPLLSIWGQVIGVNTAIAAGAQNIGFAIPANEVKAVYESVKQNGRIVRPWLGIRYVMLNELLAKSNNLEFNYGVWLISGTNDNELAVIPNSPAEKAGLKEKDIILEINDKKIKSTDLLSKLISSFKPGDEISLKIFREGKERTIKLKLEEYK